MSGWVNDMSGSPQIKGTLEISTTDVGVFIGGDPDGLRSLAELTTWLADVDQDSLPRMPDGERFHVHLYPRGAEGFGALTRSSEETEVCRLDAKGTGNLPHHLEQPPGRDRRK